MKWIVYKLQFYALDECVCICSVLFVLQINLTPCTPKMHASHNGTHGSTTKRQAPKPPSPKTSITAEQTPVINSVVVTGPKKVEAPVVAPEMCSTFLDGNRNSVKRRLQLELSNRNSMHVLIGTNGNEEFGAEPVKMNGNGLFLFSVFGVGFGGTGGTCWRGRWKDMIDEFNIIWIGTEPPFSGLLHMILHFLRVHPVWSGLELAVSFCTFSGEFSQFFKKFSRFSVFEIFLNFGNYPVSEKFFQFVWISQFRKELFFLEFFHLRDPFQNFQFLERS